MTGIPIAEVARRAQVSSRTLRHYDDIGLLHPASVGANGHRYYERAQLLRLQRILLLRDLGLGLGVIAQVLAGEQDEVAALRRHRELLEAEGRRLHTLAETVARTIEELEGGPEVPDLFEGFEEKQAQWEEEMVGRYGEGVRAKFAETRAKTAGWTRADHVDAAARYDALDARMVAVIQAGEAPGSDAAFAVLDDHHAAVARYWTPDAQSYRGLGGQYVDDPDFRARYDATDPRLAEFYRDAMAAYAEQRLT
jgi:MerR family transcriptional regulator, thiopeptide resistance regulator